MQNPKYGKPIMLVIITAFKDYSTNYHFPYRVEIIDGTTN